MSDERHEKFLLREEFLKENFLRVSSLNFFKEFWGKKFFHFFSFVKKTRKNLEKGFFLKNSKNQEQFRTLLQTEKGDKSNFGNSSFSQGKN